MVARSPGRSSVIVRALRPSIAMPMDFRLASGNNEGLVITNNFRKHDQRHLHQPRVQVVGMVLTVEERLRLAHIEQYQGAHHPLPTESQYHPYADASITAGAEQGSRQPSLQCTPDTPLATRRTPKTFKGGGKGREECEERTGFRHVCRCVCLLLSLLLLACCLVFHISESCRAQRGLEHYPHICCPCS